MLLQIILQDKTVALQIVLKPQRNFVFKGTPVTHTNVLLITFKKKRSNNKK